MILLNRPSRISILLVTTFIPKGVFVLISVAPCVDEVETQPASDTTEFVLPSFVKNAIALRSTIFNLPDHHHGCLPTIQRTGATTLCKRANILPR